MTKRQMTLRIRRLYAVATAANDGDTMTLCEIALGGNTALSRMARASLEAHLMNEELRTSEEEN